MKSTVITFFVLGLIAVSTTIAVCAQANKKSNVYVAYEWDKLEEVILGSPKMLTVPGYYPTVEFGFNYSKDNKKWMEDYGGTPIEIADKDFYDKLVFQSNNLEKVLKENGVTVHRLDPDMLSKEELDYMQNLEKGFNFLYPRDPVLVIGNNVIETSLKIPMRAREKFIVRKIFKPFLESDKNIQYVATPSVSPSFKNEEIYIEGGDVLLNGKEIYVGFSGNATSVEGINWLQRYLGQSYKVHQINIKNFQHLDCVMSLIRPGLGIIVKEAFTGELPDSLKKWDFIEVPVEDANNLAANIFILEKNKVIIDERYTYLENELKKRGVTVIKVPFDALSQMGGGFRCSHHPIRRVPVK